MLYTASLLASFVLPVLAFPALNWDAPPDPSPIDSRIAAVDVYPSTALVTRVGEVPAGDGRFVVRGLPGSADPSSVTLRAPGSEIVRLEVLDRFEQSVPAQEIAAASARLAEVRARLAELVDELEINALLSAHYATLLDELARGAHADSAGSEGREPRLRDIGRALSELAATDRAYASEREQLGAERARLELDIARWERGETVHVRDVVLELIDTDGDADAFELDYLVGGAHWEPYYDLRADGELTGVDLVFRARVHQRTGEDWNDARIALSTVQPRRRLSAPEPAIRWVDTTSAKGHFGVASDSAPIEMSAEPAPSAGFFYDDGPDGDFKARGGEPYTPLGQLLSEGRWAAIQADGVNHRYLLPTAQTIVDRPEPTAVLVGRHALDVTIERVCLAEYDTTVWLRGRATNTSPWMLLEGEASVFVGSTYLGRTALARVREGEDFDVPLGEDPTITVERIETEREVETAGVFSSTETLNIGHRIKIVNTAPTGAPKRVLVHESVPRANTDSVEVEVDRASPALASGERWEELRTEQGLITWVVELAPRAERQIELRVSLSYPESRRLLFR